jgi:hypothetical protein
MPPRERKLDDDQLKILPRSESSGKVRHLSLRSESTGAKAIGALAVGAFAIGALAIGAVVIGRLAIGRTRIRRLEVDELVVRRLRITDELQVPDKFEAEKDESAREIAPSLRHER